MEILEHKSKSLSWAMLMFIACGVAFCCYFGSYMRFPVVPLYARGLGIDTPHIGFINSAFFLMAGFLSFPLGLVSDRVGRKLLACLGLLILAGASFMLYFSDTFILITLSYLFLGIGLAAFDTGFKDPASWLNAADKALYLAKNSGRNRIASNGGKAHVSRTQPV